MNRDPNPQAPDYRQPTLGTYLTGFGLSLALTLLAFSLVWRYLDSDRQMFSAKTLLIWISLLAVVQLLVQLVFFLHLSRESKPRWNLSVLAFAAVVVIILVFGSLWIMMNLKYHQGAGQNPSQTEQEIIDDEAIHP